MQIIIVGSRHPLMGLGDTYFFFLRNLEQIDHFGTQFIHDNWKDPLFQYFTYFYTQIFGANEPLYLLLFSMPYIFVITYLIYKYSDNIFLSFILFGSTQMFTISFTLMRQINAMAVLILAFILLERKKTKSYFFVLVLISSFLHQVSLIFLVVPFLVKYLEKRRFLAILLPFLGLGLGIFFRSFVQQFVHFVVDVNDRFEHMITRGQAVNLTMFFIFTIITFVALFFSNKATNSFLKKSTIMSLFGLLFLSLTVVNREFGRVGYLFLPFLLIAYPNALNYIEERSPRLFVQISSVVILVIYYLFFLIHTTGLYPYVPFWRM